MADLRRSRSFESSGTSWFGSWIAAEEVDRAEEGTISAVSSSSECELTLHSEHKVLGLDAYRPRLHLQTVGGLVNLRLLALDRVQCSFSAEGLLSASRLFLV